MEILESLADLLLGAQCPGCDVAGWGMCPACRARLDVQPNVLDRVPGLVVAAANDYRPLLARTIPRYKDDGALHLEGFLGLRLAAAVAALRPEGPVTLVPVPSRPSAVRERGFDHGRRLAAIAARRLGLSVAPVLRRRGAGKDQQGLGAVGRGRNLAGAMRATRPVAGALLVDDVLTTGSSLQEARRALSVAGGEVLGAAVIANADDGDSPRSAHALVSKR